MVFFFNKKTATNINNLNYQSKSKDTSDIIFLLIFNELQCNKIHEIEKATLYKEFWLLKQS